LFQFHVGIDVLLVKRILVPEEVETLDCTADAHSIRIAIAPSRIEHQREIVANRFADGFGPKVSVW